MKFQREKLFWLVESWRTFKNDIFFSKKDKKCNPTSHFHSSFWIHIQGCNASATWSLDDTRAKWAQLLSVLPLTFWLSTFTEGKSVLIFGMHLFWQHTTTYIKFMYIFTYILLLYIYYQYISYRNVTDSYLSMWLGHHCFDICFIEASTTCNF